MWDYWKSECAVKLFCNFIQLFWFKLWRLAVLCLCLCLIWETNVFWHIVHAYCVRWQSSESLSIKPKPYPIWIWAIFPFKVKISCTSGFVSAFFTSLRYFPGSPSMKNFTSFCEYHHGPPDLKREQTHFVERGASENWC